MVKVVTYDLVEFLEMTDPRYPIRFEVRVRAIDDVVRKMVLRLYGVGHDERNVVVYEERVVFRAFIDENVVKAKLEEWNDLIEKLGAKPGRYLPR